MSSLGGFAHFFDIADSTDDFSSRLICFMVADFSYESTVQVKR